MNKAIAVIGAGLGDEGKGLLVDAIAADLHTAAVVVRSNGGAQAGHTVVTPQGHRHVFHHLGSGAFAGAGTHLSRHMVVHPMLFLDERTAVAAAGGNVEVTVDPLSSVTTPFDVMINQAIETARNTGRHGSCGVGFGETIERNLREDFALVAQDLLRHDLAERLRQIRGRWVPERLERLGIALDDETAAFVHDDRVIASYLADCAAFVGEISFLRDRHILERGQVIFEGAQGLLLDQDYGVFPHVTRSNTGLKNMLAIAEEARIDQIGAVYVTRAYRTRHGAGPLEREQAHLPGFEVADGTNEPNKWQGSIRYGHLDADILQRAISHDLNLAIPAVTVSAGLAVTCLDQATTDIPVYYGGDLAEIAPHSAASRIAEMVGLDLIAQSWGPSRETMRQHGEVQVKFPA